MRKLIPGLNDLATLHPKVAAEADGWDPKNVTSGSNKKMTWKCKKGHSWKVKINDRISYNTWCPYCANRKIWTGFNNLETLFPNIAAEADGWDPKTVTSGSNKVKKWKCNKGHTWQTTPYERTGRDKTGCPVCAEYGFNPGKQSWFYLLERKGEQLELNLFSNKIRNVKR